MVAVSRADFPKNTNVTIELATHTLTRLKASSLDMRKAHIPLQLDNMSSSDKKNILMRYCAHMTSSGNVAFMDVLFLWKDHTREGEHIAMSVCSMYNWNVCACLLVHPHSNGDCHICV